MNIFYGYYCSVVVTVDGTSMDSGTSGNAGDACDAWGVSASLFNEVVETLVRTSRLFHPCNYINHKNLFKNLFSTSSVANLTSYATDCTLLTCKCSVGQQ